MDVDHITILTTTGEVTVDLEAETGRTLVNSEGIRFTEARGMARFQGRPDLAIAFSAWHLSERGLLFSYIDPEGQRRTRGCGIPFVAAMTDEPRIWGCTNPDTNPTQEG